MKKLLIVLLLLNTGCYSFNKVPDCRHSSLLSCLMARDAGYDVRIIIGVTPEGRHAQCVARIRDSWVWMTADCAAVYSTDMDDFLPDASLTIDEAMAKWGWYPKSAKKSYRDTLRKLLDKLR